VNQSAGPFCVSVVLRVICMLVWVPDRPTRTRVRDSGTAW